MQGIMHLSVPYSERIIKKNSQTSSSMFHSADLKKLSKLSISDTSALKKELLKKQQQDSGYIDETVEVTEDIEYGPEVPEKDDVVVITDEQDVAAQEDDIDEVEEDTDDELEVPLNNKKVHFLVSPATLRKCAINDYYFLDYYFDLLRYLHHRKQRLEEFKHNAATSNWSPQQYAKEWKLYCSQETSFLRTRRARTKVGQFQILAQIGQGGYGEVYLAHKKDTNEICALKKIHKRTIVQINEQHHILTERDILVQISAKNSSKWLVRLLYAFQDKESLYFALEFVPGGDLRSLLNSGGVLREFDAIFYFCEICVAVDELHKLGFIHRDLKPENFLVDNTGHLKLIDFGLAKGSNKGGYNDLRMESLKRKFEAIKASGGNFAHYNSIEKRNFNKSIDGFSSNDTRAFSLVGSPDYMAAEVLMASAHAGKTGVYAAGYDYLVDYWSIGCIFFEFLAGYPPFAAPTNDEVWINLYHWQEVFERPEYDGEDAEFNISDAAWHLITTLVTHRHLRAKSISQLYSHRLFINFNQQIEKALIATHKHASETSASFLWKSMRDIPARYIKPPFIPQLKNEMDISHFDDFNSPAAMALYKEVHEKKKKLDEEVSGKPIETRSVFSGFTFKHKKAVEFRRPCHDDLVHDLAFDCYGARLATCSSDQRIKVFDMIPSTTDKGESFEWVLNDSWKAHDASVLRVQWAHPEFGQIIASCSFDKSVRIFEEIDTEQKLSEKRWAEKGRLVDSRGTVQDIEFCPHHAGLKLATISVDGNLRIYEAIDIINVAHWSLMDDVEVSYPSKEKDEEFCLSWCKSRFVPLTIVVGCGSENQAKILRFDEGVRKWVVTNVLEGHTDLIHDIAWAPCLGRSYHVIATASKDKKVRLYKIVMKQNDELETSLMAQMSDHNVEVWRLEFNVTGTILASSGDDGKMILWKSNYMGEFQKLTSFTSNLLLNKPQN